MMLQALLADRFKLTLHHETKELPLYALTVTRNGPKFKTADSESMSINAGRTNKHVEANINMRRLVEFLSAEVDRPVLDKTGLAGLYGITLDWAVDNLPTATATGPSLFTALQEQLGLKLESAKGPVDTLVVDHANRTPTDN